mmetsp:Transcript_63014/g.99588  ORF Transcript_63014/g.99588 Transcript_63014/m.99588 type:complete len:136 (-) Transcript_63014:48-455(-)
MSAVTQLAGCNKIGFEFWKRKQLLEDQPFQTDSVLGLMSVHSGLEKLKDQTDRGNNADREAYKSCTQLIDTYTWSAFKGALSLKSPSAVQEENARKCLRHSLLCGPDGLYKFGSQLKTARFSVFAHQDMCARPME